MSLLKPPEPQIAMRKFYIRLEEPLAITAERYAEFLGTDNLDHVMSQALQFIFKRDSQFRTWLAQNPNPTSRAKGTRGKHHTKIEPANGDSQ